MAKIEITIPAMGEGVLEATIIKWLKHEGDLIHEDETIVEIATDKVDSEIASPAEGTVGKILFKDGETVTVGKVIALIYTKAGESISTTEEPVKFHEELKVDKIKLAELEKKSEQEREGHIPNVTPSGKFLSPLVRNIAHQKNISTDELDEIIGTGTDGRITKDDLLKYIESRNSVIPAAKKTPMTEEKTLLSPDTKNETVESSIIPQTAHTGNIEIIEMDRMRKLIASHMVKSKQTAPHVTTFVEADVTNLVAWRNKIKDDFFRRENEKLTYTPVFIDATIKALKDFPMINVSVDGANIILKKYYNIGIATALPSGHLIVPVIKDADKLNLAGITKALNDLANRARNQKLKPDEITGGTFTITNFGTFGNIAGTPIINTPESAILGIGAIIKKPVVVETHYGDAIAIRHVMILSLSYDHRIIDGALGGMFVKRVAEYLEKFDITLNI